MSETEHASIHQDLHFERFWFRIEKIVWVLLSILLAAAVLGVTGPGHVSRTTVSSPDAAWSAEYPRVVHARAPFEIRLRIVNGKPQDGQNPFTVTGAASASYPLVPGEFVFEVKPKEVGPLEIAIARDKTGSVRCEVLVLP